jgi:ABC-2 type transport system permease protein
VILVAGLILGARIESLARWAFMVGLILIGILPFVVLGVFLGQVVSTDAMGPVLGGGGAFLSFLGGMWVPFTPGSTLDGVGQFFPSYWIAQASQSAVSGDHWPAKGWIVVGAWTVACAVLAGWAYRRDLERH